MTEQQPKDIRNTREVVVLNLVNAGLGLRASLVSQAIKAVNLYSAERRDKLVGRRFSGFVFLVDPKKNEFYVGDLEGTWGQIDNIKIYQTYTDLKELRESLRGIQCCSPGTIEFYSPQFLEAFDKEEPVVPESYVPD